VFHKSREIYGLYEAKQSIRQLDRLLVVEGYMDVIALAQNGIHFAVATLGTATNQDSLSALLKQVRHLVFCFDGDQAGYRAADKALENALELLTDGLHLQFLMMPDGEDPDTLVRKEGPDAFQERINGATPLSRYLFNRQSEGLDLTLPEDRGELKARVEPLLKKMPRSTLRDAMWHEMLRLCGNNRGDWQNRRQPNGKGGYGERRVQEQRIDVKLSKDTQLCLALLEAPDMASEMAELCRSSRQYRQAGQFADWILENAVKDRRSLIRELATDNRAREQFYSLFDGIEHVPAREQTLAGAREMLNPNREVARKQRLASLLSEKRSLADLSAEERQELKALTGQNDD
jgi:DNA primase